MVRSNPFRASFTTTGNNWPRRQRAWVRRSTCIIRLLQPRTDGESGKIPRMTPIFHLRETPRSRYPPAGHRIAIFGAISSIVARFTPRNSVTVIDFIVLALRYTHIRTVFCASKEFDNVSAFGLYKFPQHAPLSPPFPEFIEDFNIDCFRIFPLSLL